MMNKRIAARSLAVAALLAATGASQATITVYTSLADFNAAVLNPGTDTFAGFRIDQPTLGPLNRTAGSYGYVATTAPGNSVFFGAGTTANPWLSTFAATTSLNFTGFTGGVSALGGNFFGSSYAGAFISRDVVVTATDADGAVSRRINGATEDGFLGFVSSTGSLNSASLLSVQPVGGDPVWATVDNLVLGAIAAVPEPATYALLLAGVGIVGLSARRRRAD
jgi:PEP-CTERM motif